MVEKEIIQEAAKTTAEVGMEEAIKIAAKDGVKDVVTTFGPKEWTVTIFTGIGVAVTVVGVGFGLYKLFTFIIKQIKKKQPIPVAEEVAEQEVTVEKTEKTVEAKVE